MSYQAPAKSGKDVLIAIPCLNEERYLGQMLDGALADPGAKGAVIVVADGGSTDASVAIANDYAARYPGQVFVIDNPKKVQAAAVNLVAAKFGAGRKYLVRMDVHCRYAPDYVARLRQAMLAQKADTVVVPIRSYGETCFQKAVARAQNSRLGTGGALHRHVGPGRFVDHGHHALFSLERFLAVGGYNEDFSHNEDAELDVRLQAAGYAIWLEGELIVEYIPRAAIGSLCKQYYNYGKGRAKTRLLHRRPLKVRQILPLFVAPAIALAAFAPVSPWAAAPAAIWITMVLVAGALLAARTGDVCDAFSGVAAAIMHCAWSVGFIRQYFDPVKKRDADRPAIFEAVKSVETRHV